MHPFGFGRNKSILQCRHDVRNLRKHMANVFGDLPSRKHSFLGQKYTLFGRRGVRQKGLNIFTYPEPPLLSLLDFNRIRYKIKPSHK